MRGSGRINESPRTELTTVTLLFGGEPLLIEEAADDLRTTAAELGYDERLVMTAEPGFDWGRLDEEAQSMSLFATRRLIDLRLPSGKPGDAGAKALLRFCESGTADTALLLVTGPLDKKSRQAKWYKSFDKTGRVVEYKSVPLPRLPVWIQARAKTKGMDIEKDAAMLLANYTQGNLLAAAQEIDKLKLLSQEPGTIRYQDVAGSITDNARFSIFTFVDHCLAGDAVKALRSLTGLKNEGVEPVVVIWALTRQVRTLYGLSAAIAAGQSQAQALKSYGVWSSQAPLIGKALNRYGERGWRKLLRDMAGLDRVLKGREPGDVWSGLEQACLSLCEVACVRVPV